ncbi:MAG: ABC transporter permease [Parcubacteria group bacterium]|nr:ABC transporter permease [Parcubacteria group bacterium]
MFWINTKRIIKSGFVHFWRNGVVSLASVLVMSVTLFVVGALIFMGALLDTSLQQIKEKVDINIYFITPAQENDILAIKKSLEALPEVTSVEYVSREAALAKFKDRHSGDYLTLQALDALDDNPLGATLNVRAKDTSQYESIARFLESKNALASDGATIVDKVNYYQNKTVIDRLTQIIKGSEQLGFAIALVLILVSIIITFNTIRLTIYISREEISVMKLVGAQNKYVRGPFIIEGMLYGVIASLIAIVLFYPATSWLGGLTEKFFGGMNIFHFYIEHFGQIFLTLLGTGTALGIVASFLAVRKYLRV